eukprot:TRINITY_DN76_c0_g1_i3.p1 TRINITY_DN76_c0_g1~~TRINITY_DN76_c0_g1_i3.p1  ORF type:complete len:1515 (+),score=784.46 TRINITY_DN76_c0_g1_i3:58-4602(+)
MATMMRALAPLCLVAGAAGAGSPCPTGRAYPSVEVHLNRAYGYEDADGWWNNPDPYVDAVLNSEARRTAVHGGTMHAAFDHVFCFQGMVSVQAYQVDGMTFTLLDEDHGKDDHLGTFRLAGAATGDLTLRDGSARLDVSVRVVPASDAAAVALHPDYEEADPVVYYPASYVLGANVPAGKTPPMAVGSSANMDNAKAAGLDFEGIWWMSDNPVAEELVSFAGARMNATSFAQGPIDLAVPMARAGMWSWLTDTVGDILRRYYSTGSPDDLKHFTFESTERGSISTGLTNVPLVWVKDNFPFVKYSHDCDEKYGSEYCNPTKCASTSAPGTTCADLIDQYPDDMWSRPTVFDKERWAANKVPCPWAPISNWGRPWWPDTTYTLKRIVMADGSPHPVFWNEWLEHTKDKNGAPGGKMLQSYMSNDWCERMDAAGWVSSLVDALGMGGDVDCTAQEEAPWWTRIPGYALTECVTGECLTWPNVFSTGECWQCLDKTANFGQQLPASYMTDMLQFPVTGKGYAEGWCGAEDAATGGWHFNATTGAYEGCATTEDFPGMGSTSVQLWATVKAKMQEMVGRFAEGEIWRGNELGFIISNEVFWPEELQPRGVLLGASPSQHGVVRPYLDEWFTCDAACAAGLTESARQWQSEGARPEKMAIQADVKKWVFVENFKRVFPGAQNPIDLDEFVENQGSMTTLSTITQLLPDRVTTALFGGKIGVFRANYEKVLNLVQVYYGAEMAEKDAVKACAPSKSCAHQLAGGIVDALYFAGGLSVPSAISTGMWVLYADTSAYGDMFPQDHQLDRQDPRAFFYESMRFFAPVVGLPWWEVAPERATDPAGSQYAGGSRYVLNLALANKDPNAWGADAHQFRVRPLEQYHEYFIGFADFAENATYPTQARSCPGKTLALAMGEAWFGVLDQEVWGSKNGAEKVQSGYKEQTPFVDEFDLHRRTGIVASGIWRTIVSSVLEDVTHWLPTFDSMDAVDFKGKVLAVVHQFETEKMWPHPAPDARYIRTPHYDAKEDGAVGTMKCGLTPLSVPTMDETWEEWADYQAEGAVAGGDGGDVSGAASSGWWGGVENRTAAIIAELLVPFDDDLMLVPWTDAGKYNADGVRDRGLEDFVFRGIGQHRVQRVALDDADAPAGAKYAVYLGVMEGLETREGFEKLGGDAYFTAGGEAVGIRYQGKLYRPHHTHASPQDAEGRDWQHVRTVFQGSLSALITVWDHLYDVHLASASHVLHSVMDTLRPDHPVRRLTTPHSFRTNSINHKAAYSLVGEGELVHRATALTADGLKAAFDVRRAGEGDLWSTPSAKMAAQGVEAGDVALPLHEDGKEFFEVVAKYVRASLASVYDYGANACGADAELVAFFEAMRAKQDASSNFPAALTCETLEDVLSIFIYQSTAGHVHHGSLGAEIVDPCHAPWAVVKGKRTDDGKSCGAPRTFFMQLVTFMFTDFEVPELLDDYTHLFDVQGQQAAWGQFQADLGAFRTTVDVRNAARVAAGGRAFRSFDVSIMHAGVSI